MESNQTITELLDSLNDSIEDIHAHPTVTTRIPSTLEIMVRGVAKPSALEFLFSSRLDTTISKLFEMIETGNFEELITQTDKLEELTNTLFGNGSFKGPVSQAVIGNIQASVQSKKYNEMKSHLGKTITTLKKIQLVMKNLQRGKKQFEKGSDERKKYEEAVIAIKKVLKFTARIYRNRKIINKQVWKGLNNIVHEEYEIDEALE